MDSERWHRIQDAFAKIVELPLAQQRLAVSDLCGDDQELQADLLELLQEDQHDHPLLDADQHQIAAAVLDSVHLRDLLQRQVGPYKLIRVLGEGGMGVVYLAERTDIGGLVAIKFLHSGWLSPLRRARFAAEQHVLAKLQHSSIARIYDSGSLDDGTPWFVMEFVDGRPLTEYLRQREPDIISDLELFRRVCASVQFAHSHAIVHRDLKPSNILVTQDGEVKLLDFGIAKQLEAIDETTPITITGLRFMTPAYAAPEQLCGGSVGLFTDVYALGAILYEILSGQAPLNANQKAREVEKPSAVAGRNPHNRYPGLSRQEWADLDTLCQKALLPDPARRYASVDSLARDLTSYLRGMPLEARADRFGYRLSKFARRNRTPLLVTGAGILLFAGSAAVFTIRLTQAHNAALAEAVRTTRIQHFTESLFDGDDVMAGPQSSLKVTDLLQRGKEEAESLTNSPDMQADMFNLLGEIYCNLGHFDEAEPLLQRALDERQKIFGPDSLPVASSLVSLGLLRRDQRRLDQAEDLLHRAIMLQEPKLAPDDPALERSRSTLGSVLNLRGRYREALQILDPAVQRDIRKGRFSAETAQTMTALADCYFYTADYERSARLNRQALAMNESIHGHQHPTVAGNLNNLGNVANNLGQYAGAEADFRRALEILTGWYGPNHPEVGANLTALGRTLILERKDAEGQQALERALAIQTSNYGPVHPAVAETLNQLGILAYNHDRDDEAEKDFRSAMDIWVKIYGPKHQFVGQAWANLAGVETDRKNYPQAEVLLRKALEVFDEATSAEHPDSAMVHVKLGHTLVHEQKYAEAEAESLQGYGYFDVHPSEGANYLKVARTDLEVIENNLHHSQQAARFHAELHPAAASPSR